MKAKKNTIPSARTFSTGVEHHFIEDKSRDCAPHYKTRTVPISIFYPAKLSQGTRARYVDILAPSVDEALMVLLGHLKAKPEQVTQAVEHAKSFQLNSFSGADADKSEGPYPVILYSPGGESHRFTNIPVLERIAASGYVVVTIDHPHEGFPVVYPNGDVFHSPPANDDFIEITLQRVKDVRLLLDYLEKLSRKPKYRDLLDTDQIGMFGHSRGGYVSTLAQAEDPRIKAMGNVDGFLYAYWGTDENSGIENWPLETRKNLRESTAPFLRIRGRDNLENADYLFNADAKDFQGDVNFMILAGWSHASFATSPMFRKITNRREIPSFCGLGSDEHVSTLSRSVIEFFDIYLKRTKRRTILKEGINGEGNAQVKFRPRKDTNS